MSSDKIKDDFFSISFEHIVLNLALPYDIYINSSGVENKEKFVRIHANGDILEKETLLGMKEKYSYLYVLEKQRDSFLKSLVGSSELTDEIKTKVIKDSAIKYLENLTNPKNTFSTELLVETIDNCKEVVSSIVDVIQDYTIDKLYEMIASLSFHDFYTYDHSINVSMYSVAFYRFLEGDKVTKDEATELGLCALLHDLGKLKIPTNIINNAGKLSDEDFTTIKKHPGYGFEMLEKAKDQYKHVDIVKVIRVAHEHHENYDGTGYPNGLKGDDIFLWARVVAIADFFDALTTKRSYHDVLPVDEALSIMKKTVGKKIDPKIFEQFVKFVKGVSSPELAKTDKSIGPTFDPSQPHENLNDVLITSPEGPAKTTFNLGQEKESVKEETDVGKVIVSDNSSIKNLLKQNKKNPKKK